jgi:choice-of-anchor A domain-containing protein
VRQTTLKDTTAPDITVTLPINNQVSNAQFNTSVEVTDRYSGIAEVVFEIDNSNIWQAMVNLTADTYIANIQLVHGSHSIKYRMTDIADNTQESVNISFDIDTNAPDITVNNPDSGLITNQVVQLNYTTIDEHQHQTTADLNGVNVNSGDGINQDGSYTLLVTSVDEVGNESQKKVQFIIDTTIPVITLTNLVENQQFVLNDITITGVTEAHASITLDIATVQYTTTANAQGEFEFTQVHLSKGDNQLLFNATDLASNPADTVNLTVFFNDVGECNVFGFKSATPYNTLMFENYQGNASHVQGRLAVGNDVVINNYFIGEQLDTGTAGDVLIAGGDIDFAAGQVFFGNILAAGNINVGSSVVNSLADGAQIIENAQLPISFNQSYEQLKLFSNALVELTENSTFTITDNNLHLQGDCDADIQTYHINGIELELVQSMSYECLLDNAYIVLNITGNNIGFSNLDLTGLDVIENRLIWNFNEANKVVINNINIPGSLLAVDAHIDYSDGAINDDVIFANGFDFEDFGSINGQLIAKSINSNIQINRQPLVCSNAFAVDAAPIAIDEVITTIINTSIAFTLNVMDENQSSLQYQLTSDVSSGQLVGSMPDLTYTPIRNFVGTDHFNYQVTDQFGKTNSARVQITISENMTVNKIDSRGSK